MTQFMFSNNSEVCSPRNLEYATCPDYRIFLSAMPEYICPNCFYFHPSFKVCDSDANCQVDPPQPNGPPPALRQCECECTACRSKTADASICANTTLYGPTGDCTNYYVLSYTCGSQVSIATQKTIAVDLLLLAILASFVLY